MAIRANEVTKEMVDAFNENADTSLDSEQEIIAAAVNAVLGDPTPITAEWLVANGYVVSGLTFVSPHDDLLEVELVGCDDCFEVSYGQMILANTKTIGQLRALEIGLGIRS